SPAFKVTYNTAWDNKQPIVVLTYPWKDTDSRSVMMPDEVFMGGETVIEPTILGLAKIDQGLGHVYFFGQISYQDMFSYQSPKPNIHLTHFCGFWDIKAKRFITCPSYNDAN